MKCYICNFKNQPFLVRVIYLRCCLGVSCMGSAKAGHTVVLYTKDQTLVLAVEDEWERDEWYLSIRRLMEEEVKMEERGKAFEEEDDGYCTLSPAAYFKEVQPQFVICLLDADGFSDLCYGVGDYLERSHKFVFFSYMLNSYWLWLNTNPEPAPSMLVPGLAHHGEAPRSRLFQFAVGGQPALPHGVLAHLGQAERKQLLGASRHPAAERSTLRPLRRLVLPGAGPVSTARSWRDLDGSERPR